jgi:hypothetical protein
MLARTPRAPHYTRVSLQKKNAPPKATQKPKVKMKVYELPISSSRRLFLADYPEGNSSKAQRQKPKVGSRLWPPEVLSAGMLSAGALSG